MQHMIIDWVQNRFGVEVDVEQVQAAAATIGAEAAFAEASKRAEAFLIQVGGDDLDAAIDAAVAARDWQAAELLDIPIQAEAQRNPQ